MGLAASQARLLSITSRMSDNELRSQLINNAKMRLTADTSRVSDEYIAALNKTQMMFTNFDALGNEVYQDLTFNALTTYSAYNNQYGIVNTAGQIIVSKTDAANFEMSANLEEFLSRYGLEKKTDYFETIKNSPEYLENNKGIGYYDDYGEWQRMDVDIDEMQAIYEGYIDDYGINHYGQTDSLNSLEYGDYQTLLYNYQSAQDNYNTALKHQMKEWIAGRSTLNGNTFKYNGKSLEDYYQEVVQIANSTDANALTDAKRDGYVNAFLGFAELVGFTGRPLTLGATDSSKQILAWYEDPASDNEVNDTYMAMLNLQLEQLTGNIGTTQNSYSYTAGTPHGYAVLNSDGVLQRYITSGTPMYISETGTGTPTYITGYGSGSGYISSTETTGATKVLQISSDENYTYTDLWLRPVHSGESADYTDTSGNSWKYTYSGEDYYSERDHLYEISGYSGTLKQGTVNITAESQKEALKYLFGNFRDNLLNNLGEEQFKNNDPAVMAAYNEYKDATGELVQFIYGDNASTIIGSSDFEDYLKYFGDVSWVLSTNGVFKDIDNDTHDDAIERSHYNPWAGLETTAPMPDAVEGTIGSESYTISYQAVKDLFYLDCMLEHFGMPNYTWIDTNNKDENGTAKANWYTNLYTRMQDGYKEIDDGLAKSQEWMQFAFESGLVHMEQVNKRSEWVSTLYSNCSMITESTVDVDITLAEAKYKREMAKIEAKDKRYDIELKNIDTEHESLKQEYDSIKDVISKNIERNFKLFTQG